MGKKLFYFWYFLSSLILTTSIELSCRNLDGEPVDWFAAYKLPSLDNPKNIRTGLDFLYSDPATSEWRFSSRNINDSESAIGATLSQLWTIKDDPQTFYALYNDEHPGSGKSDSNRGHMKGVLAFDDIQGFWMIHSVPNFVNLKASRYSYVESGTRNGQSFLCVTFPVTALTEIGTQLFVAQPSVYDSRLPTSFATLFPDLAKAVRMSKFVGQFSSVKNLASKNGVNFTSFSKHKKFGKDLYGDFVAQQLRSSFFVETWLNGPGDLVSYCNNTFKTFNLRSVKVDSSFSFTSSKDHSKWAVSSEDSQPIVCIGDINRQKSQMGRGGGTLCLQHASLWRLYRSSVDRIETCPVMITKTPTKSVGTFFGKIWEKLTNVFSIKT